MSARTCRRKSKSEPLDHPVVPGSVLYRALQMVARAVARRLAAQPGTVEKACSPKHDETTDREKRP